MVCVKIFLANEQGLSVAVPADITLMELRNVVIENCVAKTDRFDIFYLGKKLSGDNVKLSECAKVCDKSILFALARPVISRAVSDMPSAGDIDALLASLQTTFSDHGHRAMLVRTASNPETLKNMIDCIPGLRNDFVAQAVLKDPCLLMHWIRSENVAKNFAQHPSLYAACQQLIEHMHAEIVRHHGVPPTVYEPLAEGFGEAYSSDDENEEDNSQPSLSVPTEQQNGPRQPITQQYLAAALAAAAAVNPPAGPSGPSRSSNFGSQQPRQAPTPSNNVASPAQQLITAEMFRQAVQRAMPPAANQMPGGVASNSAQNNAPAETYDAHMSELTSMGFADQEENLRALRHSRGDVQGALEHIINEREAFENANMGLD